MALSQPKTGVPAGVVEAFAMETLPNGWITCNGAAISRTAYSKLFAAIGTNYGAGDGTTTFNIPDLRGYFVRGWAGASSLDSGRVMGSTQLDQMQRITGDFVNNGIGRSDLAKTQNGALSAVNGGATGSAGAGNRQKLIFDSGNSPNARVSADTNGETRPVNVALVYAIKY